MFGRGVELLKEPQPNHGVRATIGVQIFSEVFSIWELKAISFTVGFRLSKTALFDRNLLVIHIVSRVDFIVFVLFLEAVGV